MKKERRDGDKRRQIWRRTKLKGIEWVRTISELTDIRSKILSLKLLNKQRQPPFPSWFLKLMNSLKLIKFATWMFGSALWMMGSEILKKVFRLKKLYTVVWKYDQFFDIRVLTWCQNCWVPDEKNKIWKVR